MDIDIGLLTLIMFATLLLVKSVGMPLAFACGGVGMLFLVLLWGPELRFLVLARTWEQMTSFVLVAVPMFIFMAKILEFSGIADDLFEAIHHWWGGVRGGLAISTVIATTIIAAIVGIIGAGIVMMGLIAYPAMMKRGYNKGLALGSVCAGGCLGILIPPSVLFILYSLVAGVSVGKLFAGGILPGLLLSALFIVFIAIRCYFQRKAGPAISPEERVSIKKRLVLLKGVIAPFALILLVLGVIFAGIATPTEAAGVGCLGALVCAAIRRRLNWANLKTASFGALGVTCMLMWVFFGSYTFIGVFTLAGGAAFVEEILLGLPVGPMGLVVVMQFIMIILGMFIDWVGILMICGPLFIPIIEGLGFCPLWFGVVYNLNMQIAFLTPPFGMGLFYLKGVTPPDVSMMDLYRGVWPFIILQGIGLALVIAFPWLAVWLPGLM
ncbi:TRAP transporter large permease subunit [Dehalococcoidia bacterium]|nr:TRAP transporter large permease subunit [Dehalococcoidia bacterium]